MDGRRPYFLRAAAGGLGLAAGAAWAVPLTVNVTDAGGKPLPEATVVVMVKGAPTTAPANTVAQMGQRNRQFAPQVIVIQTGTAVQFPNFDTVRHHVYSFSAIQKFEIKLYAGTPAAPVVFDKPGVAVLGCNIHDRMAGWVQVVDSPYFAKTDAAGNATLEVPPGDHRLRLWHPALGDAEPPTDQALRVSATPQPLAVRLAVAPEK